MTAADELPARRSDRVITASVFFASTAILYVAIINDDWQDAYIHFRAGERVARGEVPYRDFFLFWFPGAPLFLGAWFKVFGTGIAGLQFLQAMCAGAMVTFGWLIARLTMPGPFSVAVPFVISGTYVVGNQGMNHMSFSAPLALLAIWATLKAVESPSRTYCLLAGAAAGLAGMFTITTGAWLGVALIATAFFFPKSRLRTATLVAAGGAAVLALLIIYLASMGLMREFVDSAIVWPRQRYAPFHTGVGWGAWLPSWTQLNIVPDVWKPAWALTLSIVWGQAYVLPFVLAVSLVLVIRNRSQPERAILLLAAAALILSAFPNAAAMRLARLSAPLWILILFELSRLLHGRPRWTNLTTAAAVSIAFALVIPLQWSYQSSFTKVQTPRGTARLQPISTFEYNALSANIGAGSRVAVVPEYRPAAWLLKLENVTKFDTLTPILYSLEQLDSAAKQIRDSGYPLVVRFMSSELAGLDSIQESFGPSRFTDEWENNELTRLFNESYITYEAGSLQILRYKKAR
ncbi:MAG TPA: glycosyltransferase family 39 protein [Planctomycetota bacterium]|nr:glycosyltransferase family 39 protein [Planctomycetota bacterium]